MVNMLGAMENFVGCKIVTKNLNNKKVIFINLNLSNVWKEVFGALVESLKE
jgi:hypothetical protein